MYIIRCHSIIFPFRGYFRIHAQVGKSGAVTVTCAILRPGRLSAFPYQCTPADWRASMLELPEKLGFPKMTLVHCPFLMCVWFNIFIYDKKENWKNDIIFFFDAPHFPSIFLKCLDEIIIKNGYHRIKIGQTRRPGPGDSGCPPHETLEDRHAPVAAQQIDHHGRPGQRVAQRWKRRGVTFHFFGKGWGPRQFG